MVVLLLLVAAVLASSSFPLPCPACNGMPGVLHTASER